MGQKHKPGRKPMAETMRRNWKPVFLASLAENGVARYACKAARIDRTTAYKHRRDDPEFAAAWDEAVDEAADRLEEEAFRRAHDGHDEPVIHQGEMSGQWVNDKGERVTETTPGAKFVPLTVRKFHNDLLMFMLKGMRPHKYRDNVTHKHEGSLVIQNEADAARRIGSDPELLELADQLSQRLAKQPGRLGESSN